MPLFGWNSAANSLPKKKIHTLPQINISSSAGGLKSEKKTIFNARMVTKVCPVLDKHFQCLSSEYNVVMSLVYNVSMTGPVELITLFSNLLPVFEKLRKREVPSTFFYSSSFPFGNVFCLLPSHDNVHLILRAKFVFPRRYDRCLSKELRRWRTETAYFSKL